MTDDLKTKLAQARDRQAEREKAAQTEKDARELEALELVDRLEKELGPLDKAFKVLATPHGVFAVKHVDTAEALYKRFTAIKDPTVEDVEAFIRPCIAHPDEPTFNRITAARPVIKTRLALALVDLFGAKEATDRGKY